MPRAAGSPTTTFELPPLTVEQLRPHPVSGHLLRKPRASGDRWHAHWRDASGRQREKVLGKVWTRRGRPAQGYLTKQGAQQLLDELLVDARKAGPAAARRDHDVTFADAAAEWLRYVEHDRRRRPTTLRDYRRMADDVLVPTFGAVPIRAVTPELVDNYRARLVAEGRLKPRTINKYLLVLHAIFKRAQRHYGLAANPVAGLDRQPVRRASEFRVLDAEEVQALCRAAREGRHRTPLKHDVGEEYRALQARLDAQDAAVYTVAAYAGLRLGEIRALRWRDVDFAKRLIHVRRAYTQNAEDAPKSGKARAVPMIDQVAAALDELSRRHQWTGDDDLVFVAPAGGHLEDSALRRRFYAALKAAGIKHLRFHDLRHSFGTLAVQVFPLSDVKAYMGHADIATTMIYVHHVPQHDAAAKLSAAVAQTTARGGLGIDPAALPAVRDGHPAGIGDSVRCRYHALYKRRSAMNVTYTDAGTAVLDPTEAEYHNFLDTQARERVGVSLEEFVRQVNAGEVDWDHPEVFSLVGLIGVGDDFLIQSASANGHRQPA